MGYRQQLVPRWLDITGGIVTQTFHTIANPAPSLGSAAAVITAMQGLSHCGLVYTELHPVAVSEEDPVNGSYPLVSDRAQIILRSSVGTTGRINVPGPVDSMFLVGSDRVDFTNPAVETLVNAALAALCDPYGNPWVTAVSGKRMKVRVPQPLGP